jgi:ABC-type cobalamin transport system ATPase subunit
VLIAQSDLNHTIRLLDREYLIERGANAIVQNPAVWRVGTTRS